MDSRQHGARDSRSTVLRSSTASKAQTGVAREIEAVEWLDTVPQHAM
jgi:hypothetical protein